MKLIRLIILALMLPACSTLTPQQQALLTDANNLAQVAVNAAATIHLGPVAGPVASKGLFGLASVVQAYVGEKIPKQIVVASPGVEAVGQAVAKQIAPNHVVKQSDVDAVLAAAKLAATLKPVLTATTSH